MSLELNIPDGMDIKRARMQNDMNQSELADKAGISQPAISKIESGANDVRIDTLQQIVDAINEA